MAFACSPPQPPQQQAEERRDDKAHGHGLPLSSKPCHARPHIPQPQPLAGVPPSSPQAGQAVKASRVVRPLVPPCGVPVTAPLVPVRIERGPRLKHTQLVERSRSRRRTTPQDV
ncbi:hypothetical protein E4U42_006319 [Claviceps africana]|uniref:Uncharacterized protein n=1 Tax=Claviceps africana TaxID=83212 RepID=A0A8K0J2T0_9HYPO|nr:hypothetical protein E4U42_006319 [Claviceps africana]